MIIINLENEGGGFDYNLLLKNSLNTKEGFEIINGCFLGNNSYLEKRSLQIVKIAKIIDMF